MTSIHAIENEIQQIKDSFYIDQFGNNLIVRQKLKIATDSHFELKVIMQAIKKQLDNTLLLGDRVVILQLPCMSSSSSLK